VTKDVTGTSRQRLYTHWCVTLRNSTVCMCMINCLNTGIHHIWDINGIYNVSKITECPVDSTPGNSRRQKSMEGVGGGIDSWSQLCDDDRTWSWLYFSLLLSFWERHFVWQCYFRSAAGDNAQAIHANRRSLSPDNPSTGSRPRSQGLRRWWSLLSRFDDDWRRRSRSASSHTHTNWSSGVPDWKQSAIESSLSLHLSGTAYLSTLPLHSHYWPFSLTHSSQFTYFLILTQSPFICWWHPVVHILPANQVQW